MQTPALENVHQVVLQMLSELSLWEVMLSREISGEKLCCIRKDSHHELIVVKMRRIEVKWKSL